MFRSRRVPKLGSCLGFRVYGLGLGFRALGESLNWFFCLTYQNGIYSTKHGFCVRVASLRFNPLTRTQYINPTTPNPKPKTANLKHSLSYDEPSSIKKLPNSTVTPYSTKTLPFVEYGDLLVEFGLSFFAKFNEELANSMEKKHIQRRPALC